MLLKGYTLHKERYDFSLKDCPVFITDSVVGLFGKTRSPLIKATTIMRGDESTGIFEGDIVYENDKQIGYVIYAKGFYVQKEDGTLKNIELDTHIQIVEGDMTTAKLVSKNPLRTKLQFVLEDRTIELTNLLHKFGGDGYIIITGNRLNKRIDPDSLLFVTGFVDDTNKPIHFGQLYKDGIVVLNNLKPMLKQDNEFIDLE